MGMSEGGRQEGEGSVEQGEKRGAKIKESVEENRRKIGEKSCKLEKDSRKG